MDTISSRLFTFHKGNAVAEASDLYGYDLRGRVYPDAADEGFIMESHLTGIAITLYLAETVRHESEITHWLYRPTVESVRANPAIARLTVSILND